MAAAQELTPTSYITHHLTFFAKRVGENSTLHVDTLVTAVILGVVGIGFFWWIARRATSGVPSRTQAFVELALEFVNGQVKGIFHGDTRFVGPLALTIFVWVLLMNAMDFLPIDIMAWIYENVFHLHNWRGVPTADVNTTFALALSVFGLMIFYAIKQKGLFGWIHELFCTPFGSNPFLWLLNFLFNIVEYVSKPLSHSLRLYGNMYAGEIIFMLLGLLASVGAGWMILSAILGAGWAIFHILIVVLQAYIFMMLTIVYIQMSHEGH